MQLKWRPESGNGADKVPERGERKLEDQWDLTRFYPDANAWNADFARIEELVAPFEVLRGRLHTAADIGAYLAADTELDRLLSRLYVYAKMRADEDTANTDNQARLSRIQARLAEVGGRLAWIHPEILANPEEDLRAWLEADELAADRFEMTKLLRRKAHTLSEKEETLLSRASEIFAMPQKAFGFLTDADLTFPKIKDSTGQERELSKGRYITFLIDKDRRVRKEAFEKLHDTYGAFKNTLTATITGQVKLQNYMAQTRNFPSALEAALHPDNVPATLYESLIKATRAGLPHFFKYLEIRREQLELDELDMYDVYVPIVPEFEMKVPFEQAHEWVLAACAPLGKAYTDVLETAFTDRWIDIYENRGKRAGAYSSGCYDSLPYILLNYQGTLDDVFTLAHELGHSMHTYLANQTQPPRYADYPIFTAEIPSTLNEELLLHYLLGQTDDPKFRAYLLNQSCDSFKGTVYRQTMFAEFEKMIHELDAEGTPLTAEFLSERYYQLNADFFGPALKADQRIGLEWSRVPHFYYNYYVYKYATSFCASQIFVQRVLAGETEREQFLDLLRAGGSDDPLALIQRAGVDLTDPQTLEGAFTGFAKSVDQLGAILKEL